MNKKIKYGYIKGTSTTTDAFQNESPYIFDVMITRETDDTYEIKYGKSMISGGKPAHEIDGLPKVVSKEKIYGIYERNLNWFQRLFNNEIYN